MPAKLTGKVYKTVTSKATDLQGAETWVTFTRKRQENGYRDEGATVDVCSDTQRQDQERTHLREKQIGAGLQKDHGDTIHLVRACDE